jgi:two-component sensor histidine kinase/DNA-binding response OmpR family regulator
MPSNDKINVLLVDDQPAKLMAYEVILSELGENLLKAASAREAFEHLLKTDVAIVLIDVCMPELDGFQLAAMIHEHPRFQRTAIIFISAIHLTDVDRLRGYEMGAVDYVPVPVVPEVLRAKVRVFAELYRKTRELEQLNAELEDRVRQRTEELESSTKRLLQSERLQSLALAAGKMGTWSWDTVKAECTWDEGQCRIFGLEPHSFTAKVEDLHSFIHPDDWQSLGEALGGLTKDAPTCQIEFRARRPNGEIRWCVGAAAANVDESNRVVLISGVTADLTDQRQADERRTLLVREVDHRARNALAVVQSIVRLTKAPTIDAYQAAVEGRIRALSTAHALLSESRWEGADLDRLVNEELAPYLRAEAHRISLSGPAVILQPSVAQILAVVLHELATNAAKYGALSTTTGTVGLSWELGGPGLVLHWDERNGPPVQSPVSPGYGTKVITASVEYQLGGSAAFDWRPGGLHFTLSAPLSENTELLRTGLNGVGKTRRDTVRPQKASVGGRRLLLIEDEMLVGMMMHDTLTELGFDVVGPISTMSGAAEAIEHEEFDAAILDVNLNGEFIYPLADIVASRGLPFVFVTGYSAEGIESRFAKVPVLQKPIEIERLQDVFVLDENRCAEETLRVATRA